MKEILTDLNMQTDREMGRHHYLSEEMAGGFINNLVQSNFLPKSDPIIELLNR